MYALFSGTTTHYVKLLKFLGDNTTGYTLLNGHAGWRGTNLQAQLIVFFDKNDAEKTANFLKRECGQEEVTVLNIEAKEIYRA